MKNPRFDPAEPTGQKGSLSLSLSLSLSCQRQQDIRGEGDIVHSDCMKGDKL